MWVEKLRKSKRKRGEKETKTMLRTKQTNQIDQTTRNISSHKFTMYVNVLLYFLVIN